MPLHLTKADRDNLLNLARDLTGSTGWFPDAKAWGAQRGETLAAVAVFQNFRLNDADLHFAVVDGARVTLEVIQSFVTLAFHPRVYGLHRVWANIAESNTAAQRAALGVGFGFEYRQRSGFVGGEDAIVLSMTRPGAARSLPDQS